MSSKYRIPSVSWNSVSLVGNVQCQLEDEKPVVCKYPLGGYCALEPETHCVKEPPGLA